MYSLSQLVRWLGGKAEELGIEIYPGFSASEVIISCASSTCVSVLEKPFDFERFYTRCCTMQVIRLLGLQPKIWEYPKMVPRRRLSSQA